MHELEPEDLFLRYALAMEYLGMESNDEAASLLRTILLDDPHHIASYYQLGKIVEQTNEAEALVLFERGFQEALLQKSQRTANEFRAAIDELQY